MQKIKTPRDPKYLSFVRSQNCCICGHYQNIAAHHTESGGMAIKGSDYSAVPLCLFCHSNVHLRGAKDNIPNLEQILARLKARWELKKNEGHAK